MKKSQFFWLYLLLLTLLHHLIRKNKRVHDRQYFRDIYVQYIKLAECSNHKKVIVVVNCRTGYQLEDYQPPPPQTKKTEKHKILTSKLKFLR